MVAQLQTQPGTDNVEVTIGDFAVNGIRKLTHFRHLKTDPPGLVMRPL
jgi:hypothetical protein